MTADEKRDAAHARMRRAFDRGCQPLIDWSDAPTHIVDREMDLFRAGFLAALRYARDEMPRVLTDGELERVRSA